jgi:uncharacterized YigZ family protein
LTDHFFTLSKSSNGLYKEKGSKFISSAFTVSSIDDINSKLEELQKEYHDARHHCYAYILGHDATQFRANDDGEPNHSAGDPILGQLRSYNLTNSLIVVVRYFGGTKLGISGLINAYKTAAEEAINNNIIVKEFITSTIQLSYPYSCTTEVMKLIDKFNLKILSQEFLENCSLQAEVVISSKLRLLDDIQLLVDTGNEIKLL